MGSKQTSSNNVPKYIEQGGMEAVQRASGIADMGYVPYVGPDVALPGQGTLAGWQNQNAGSSAFGLAAPSSTGLEGMPVSTAGGISGFSSAPGLQAAIASLQRDYPGLYTYLTNMTINPQTGAAPAYRPAAAAGGGLSGVAGGLLGGAPMTGWHDDGGGGDGMSGGYGDVGASSTSYGGGGFGGYSGIGDMFDGGGPGASGGAFEGGGRVSDIANAVTGR